MERVKSMSESFLLDKFMENDLVRMRIKSIFNQEMECEISRVYSNQKTAGCKPLAKGDKIICVQAPGTWGAEALKPGDEALVFLACIGSKFYEDPWRGHFFIEPLNGLLYGIYQEENLWENSSFPEQLRAVTIQDPKRNYASAILFEKLEEYFLGFLERQHHGPLKT